jgi:hypothetical protein
MNDEKDFTTLQKWTALQLPAGGAIRTTPEKQIAVYDWLRAEGYKNPRQTFDRLKKQYPEVVPFCDSYKFSGRGQLETPVVGREGFEALFAVLPGKRGHAYRLALRQIARGFFAGDPAMIEHMINRQEDPEALKRIELRARAKHTNKRLNFTILRHGGTKEGRENIYALVGGCNNQTVYGRTAKEIQQTYQVRQTRDALDSTRLSLMVTAEELEAINIARRRAWGNPQILAAVDEVCRDIEGLREKYGIGPLALPRSGFQP